VLDTQLGKSEFVAGDDYTIADIAIYPWYGGIVNGAYSAAEFLSVDEYTNIRRWMDQLEARPGVKRGRLVNRTADGLKERHDAADFNSLPGLQPT